MRGLVQWGENLKGCTAKEAATPLVMPFTSGEAIRVDPNQSAQLPSCGVVVLVVGVVGVDVDRTTWGTVKARDYFVVGTDRRDGIYTIEETKGIQRMTWRHVRSPRRRIKSESRRPTMTAPCWGRSVYVERSGFESIES